MLDSYKCGQSVTQYAGIPPVASAFSTCTTLNATTTRSTSTDGSPVVSAGSFCLPGKPFASTRPATPASCFISVPTLGVGLSSDKPASCQTIESFTQLVTLHPQQPLALLQREFRSSDSHRCLQTKRLIQLTSNQANRLLRRLFVF